MPYVPPPPRLPRPPRPTHLAMQAFTLAAQNPRPNACFRTGLAGHLHQIHDDQNWTALDLAISMDLPVALKRLISHGALLDMHEGSGVPALGYAISVGKTSMARILIKAGAHIEAMKAHFPSPLILAAQLNDPECAALLVEAGACLSWRCKRGGDALSYAQGAGSNEVIAYLQDAIRQKEARDIAECLAPVKARPRKRIAL